MRDIIQIEIKSTASGKVDLINILIDFFYVEDQPLALLALRLKKNLLTEQKNFELHDYFVILFHLLFIFST